ncbi:MAG: HAD family phosphatase [Alphaproteobacteria bacterium]|nr:HAD family phosphatase [Alphaproteobacteria bacterium]
MSRPGMIRPEAVIFDCDGVLIDSERVANRILAEDLRAVGLSLTGEEAHRRFTGTSLSQIERVMLAETGRAMPDGWIDRHHQALYHAFETELVAIPGVVAVLDTLDTIGMPWGVASQSAPEYLEHTLSRVGIWHRALGRVASAKQVSNPKPAPDVYLLACARVGCDPARSVVIEDSPTGVQAGVAAGAHVIGYAADRPAEDLLAAGAAATFTDMTALPALLGLS